MESNGLWTLIHRAVIEKSGVGLPFFLLRDSQWDYPVPSLSPTPTASPLHSIIVVRNILTPSPHNSLNLANAPSLLPPPPPPSPAPRPHLTISQPTHLLQFALTTQFATSSHHLRKLMAHIIVMSKVVLSSWRKIWRG